MKFGHLVLEDFLHLKALVDTFNNEKGILHPLSEYCVFITRWMSKLQSPNDQPSVGAGDGVFNIHNYPTPPPLLPHPPDYVHTAAD